MTGGTALRPHSRAWHALGDTLERYEHLVGSALGVPDALAQLSPGIARVLERPVDPVRLAGEDEADSCLAVAHRVMRTREREVRSYGRVPRPRGAPTPGSPGVVSSVGVPLLDEDGVALGALVAADRVPRLWSEQDLHLLDLLAGSLSAELAQRLRRLEDLVAAAAQRAAAHRSHERLQLSLQLATATSVGDVAETLHGYAVTHWGAQGAELWLLEGALDEGADQDTGRMLGSSAQRGWRSFTVEADPSPDLLAPGGADLLRVVTRPRHGWYPPTSDGLPSPSLSPERRRRVPLVDDGIQVGALAIALPEAHEPWEPEDMAAIVRETTRALRRIIRDDLGRAALETLRVTTRAVLPTALGLRLSGRYRPAQGTAGIGGDWYDVVVSPSGSTSMVVGDVTGHDMSSAAPMSQVRATLRALAWALEDPPSVQVAMLEKAVEALDLEVVATLVYARLDARDNRGDRLLTWANAGHPPPLMITSSGEAHWLTGETCDLMIGVLPDVEREDHTAVVPPGATLLLYTDGLVERRDQDIDAGLDRLREVATRHHDRTPEELVDLILDELQPDGPSDDIALLAIRSEPRRSGGVPAQNPGD